MKRIVRGGLIFGGIALGVLASHLFASWQTGEILDVRNNGLAILVGAGIGMILATLVGMRTQ